MHGSLLPQYRGRAPVNWAVLHGERETGATLHYMTAKPDAGDIVAQTAVPILPDDTAREVFDKVTVAAEIALDRVLPALIAGTAPRMPHDLARGLVLRRPQARRTAASTGRSDAARSTISCARSRRRIPARSPTSAGVPARVLRTRVLDPATPPAPTPTLEVRDGRLVARCGGGGTLRVLALRARRRALRRGGVRRALRRRADAARRDCGERRGHA